MPTAMRASFQGAGQNCAGAERIIVYDAIYEDFCAQIAAAVGRRASPRHPPERSTLDGGGR